MLPLSGCRIALLETRKSTEIADLVRRLGGEPVTAPAVQEVPRLNETTMQLDRLANGEYRALIILTGSGIAAVLREAEARNQLAAVLESMRRMIVACRGPKPLAVLKRYEIRATITTAKPHTSQELLAALDAVDLHDQPVMLVHYGERNEAIANELRARGALLDEACPYEWAMPDNPQPIAAVVTDALTQRLDAILFTSQIQCRHLFQVAAEMRLMHELAAALNRDVVVGAIGPVCAVALKEFGVRADVMPAAPNMASLIAAVGDYFELTREEHKHM
jgi:uroporphyrinogen-III synthase